MLAAAKLPIWTSGMLINFKAVLWQNKEVKRSNQFPLWHFPLTFFSASTETAILDGKNALLVY